MNFYEHQDRARRRTLLLVVYFALTVAALALAVDAVVYGAMRGAGNTLAAFPDWLDSAYGAWTSAAVCAVVAAGSLHASVALAGGGTAVAAMVGARRLAAQPATPAEQRLRNVVEEMAIAAGLPLPALYVMDDEAGINAFVAGTRPTATALVVTQGALDAFTRDELQAVVAHEFSHVFNHDMRLNVRLLALLGGVLLLSRLGRVLLRATDRSDGKGAGQVALLGLALLALGYVGVLAGRLLQSAISRQREYLADASAVQFTRNPAALAGALARILEHARGGQLRSVHADALAHFCIAPPIARRFTGWFDSHPPLEARIAAIDPGFDVKQWQARQDAATGSMAAPALQAFASDVDARAIAARPGRPLAADLAGASTLYGGLPSALLDAARAQPRALVLALALAEAGMAPASARTRLDATVDADESALACRLGELVARQTAAARLALLTLAMPGLIALTAAARARTLAAVRDLMLADRQVTLLEFVVYYVLRDHLRGPGARALPARYFAFAAVARPLRTLFGALARQLAGDEAAAARIHALAWRPFALGDPALPAAADCTLDAVMGALHALARLSPLLKQSVIRACADCVLAGGAPTPEQYALLRAIALALDCPLPLQSAAA